MLTCAPFLAGCVETTGGAASKAGRAALLLPLSGSRAAVGATMQRAALLAQSSKPDALDLDIRDTGGDPALAARMAAAAVADGAVLILGPLTAAEVADVLTAAQGVPVITFSNDAALIGSGAYVFGLTQAQSVAAIFAHARDTMAKRIAVMVPRGRLGEQAVAAARTIAPQAGLTLTAALSGKQETGGLISALKAEGGGVLPDAILLPHGGPSLDVFAAELAGSGVQLLGTAQWSVRTLSDVEALHGAAFAAPNPEAFSRFAQVYQSRHGRAPGILAGLAFDAVTMAQVLSQSGTMTRAGVTRPTGFGGIVGDFRLRADGACLRELAILTVGVNGERVFTPAVSG